MGYFVTYKSIVDTLINLVDINIPDINEIVFGEKERVGTLNFPILFIIPQVSSIEDISTKSNVQKHVLTFELVFVLKDLDLQEGLWDVIKLAGDMVDVLKDNRTLNGRCLYLEIGNVNPGYAKIEQVVLHWASIELKIQIII